MASRVPNDKLQIDQWNKIEDPHLYGKLIINKIIKAI